MNRHDDQLDADLAVEEALFREAFARYGDEMADEPVAYEGPRSRTERAVGSVPPRTRWLAAAAAVVLIGGSGYLWLDRTSDAVPDPAGPTAVPSSTTPSATPSRAATASPSASPSTIERPRPTATARPSTTAPTPTGAGVASTRPTAGTTGAAPDRPGTGASGTGAPGTGSPGTGAPGTGAPGTGSAPGTWSASSVQRPGLMSGLPAATAAWHWISIGPLAAQVPDEWGTADGPCLDDANESSSGPYVYFNTIGGIDKGLKDCAPGTRRTTPVPVLYLRPSHDGSIQGEPVPSNAVQRTIGSHTAFVRMSDASVLPAAERSLAQKILATVRTYGADRNGCEAHAPIPPMQQPRPKAWDIAAGGTVEAMSVCQYEPVGQLIGSAELGPNPGVTLLERLARTPKGTQKGAASCGLNVGRRTVLKVRMSDGTVRELYVYNEDCTNYVDDGTTRRTIADWCRGIYDADPLDRTHYQGVGRICTGG